jgi:hypothetical protein
LVGVVAAIVVAVGFALVLNIYSKSQQRVRFRLKLFGSKAFPEARGVAMRKTPLALNTSDFWKLNDLIDALYVIVDCHLRAKIKPSG